MKKLAIFGGIIVVLFAVIIVLTNMSNEDKLADNPYGTKDLKQSTIDLLTDENYQNIILPEPLQEKIDSGEPVLAYLFSPECSHCKNLTPKLMPIAEKLDLQIDQLNVLEFDQAWTTYSLEATPTLIYFDKGEEVNRLVGDAPEETIHQFFNEVVLKK
ncbi:thioredoxin family protein [Solibacillus sp. FSL H8-0538]|uniref:thioredoxin family protein n=1 Tax=Solibacillus sp. FSL H8-0538 TaxID=2921400 RepID=UPI0030F4DC5D